MGELERIEKAWTDRLKEVRTIVSHKDCADGVASALLLNQLMPQADVILCQYNHKEHRELRCDEGMIFCDMSPPKDRAEEFIEAGAIVIDHHVSQKELVESFGPINGIYGTDRCGAELAYDYVWKSLNRVANWPQELVELCGIYDCWRKDNGYWEDACALREALLLYPFEKLFNKGLWNIVADLESMIGTGEAVLRRKREKAERVAASCYHSHGVLFCQRSGLANYIADHLRDTGSEHMFVAAWSYKDDNGKLMFTVSLRSLQENIDVSKIAVSCGGGGHRAAASFAVPFKITHGNPISKIMDMIAGPMFAKEHIVS